MNTSPRQSLKKSIAALARFSGLHAWRRRSQSLVVLMLHKVNDDFDPLPLTVSTRNFAAMLQEIDRCGIEVVSLKDYVPRMAGSEPEQLKIAITFDDGYQDNYTNALPLLKLHDMPATVYLSVDHVNGDRMFWYETLVASINRTIKPQVNVKPYLPKPLPLNTPEEKRAALLLLNDELKQINDEERMIAINAIAEQLQPSLSGHSSSMLSWDMIREMTTAGITMGSHTMSHPILSRENVERVRKELTESKQAIEEQTGSQVTEFAYPNGTPDDFNEQVIREVQSAGYASACTTIPGFNNRSTNPFQLHRVNLHNAMCQNSSGEFDGNLFWSKVLQIF